MKKIQVGGRRIRKTGLKWALVDDEDFEYLNQFVWFPRVTDKKERIYAFRNVCRDNKVVERIQMHRDLMKPESGMVVDHIDSDGLNNQRCNLRICTNQQNICNRQRKKNSVSGYKGVTPNYDKWLAQITFKKKHHYLGRFETPQEASEAYKKAALELHGEFARYD